MNETGDAAKEQPVAIVSASLIACLRSGLLEELSETARRLSVITGDRREIDIQACNGALHRLDATRQLLQKVGLSARGSRPDAVLITEGDHPKLALRALEGEYHIRLTQAQETANTSLRTSKLLAELGDLVAALRERLDVPSTQTDRKAE